MIASITKTLCGSGLARDGCDADIRLNRVDRKPGRCSRALVEGYQMDRL